MSLQKRGRRYENQLARDIYEACGGALMPEPIGYSGNHGIPAPDLRVDDGDKVHAFELKRTSTDRQSLVYEPDDRSRDDLAQLIHYAREYPRMVVPYVGVRFDNRQLVLAKLWLGAPNDSATVRSATKTVPTTATLTRANNLSVHKPSLDEWVSAQAGDDAQYVLDTIGHDE